MAKQQIMGNEPATIVAFDNCYKLVAIFHSISEAASMTKTLRQSLSKAAYGEMVSAGNRYWRVVPSDFQIDPEDIGQLTIFDFDKEVGEDRKIYSTKKMLKSSSMYESEYLSIINKRNKK